MESQKKREKKREGRGQIDLDTRWYKRAVIYQLHVRSFFDSNGDGVGDFPGLTQKLDYLQELGVTAIWLLPFYPSPLKDDGYDIADYYSINPMYGTLDDFRTFLEEAHARGLRVITELVINHTSDQHPWFQRARRAPSGSVERDYYVWSDTPERYKETRIIFPDYEPSNWTWDPVANAYYWHRFFHHQPDLNFDNLEVHEEITRILDFWLEMGVDGMRLDAIPYLYEREGTSCESLPETHAFLKKMRRHVDEKYGDRVFLAEANQWPEFAVHYFGEGQGDECHMAFHFPLMPRLFMSVRMEDRFPIIDILAQTPAIPETSQWAIFLRNHDELTLEMVTDEERDYMYRMYAADARSRINLGIRRRLAPLLQNDRRTIELLNILLLSLPGTPVIYYGDEIGMGDNPYLGDRNGVRTPMHWSSDKNAGFSRASPQALFFPVIVEPEYHFESNNVEAQQRNPNSLLWWMRRVLNVRKRWRPFTEGNLEFLAPSNRKVLAYLRRTPDETVLVVANLSRFAQAVELDLNEFANYVPVELFGHTEFPAIEAGGYSLTLAPYSAYCCLLDPKKLRDGSSIANSKEVRVEREWREIFQKTRSAELEEILARYIAGQPWFQGKNRTVTSIGMQARISLESCELCLLNVDYNEAESEHYLVPMGFISGAEAELYKESDPGLAISRLETASGESGLLCDTSGTEEFWQEILKIFTERRGKREATRTLENEILETKGTAHEALEESDLFKVNHQSNTSAAIDRKFIKMIRRVEVGVNPEFEIGRELAREHSPLVGNVLGQITMRIGGSQSATAFVVSHRISSTRSAWEVALDALGRYYDRILTQAKGMAPKTKSLFSDQIPPGAEHFFGTFPELARLLGQRTGELHLALAGMDSGAEVRAESYYPFSQRSLYQSMRNLALRTLQQLQAQKRGLPAEAKRLAEKVINRQDEVIAVFKGIYQERFEALRIRCHGNLHLGQALHTGKDFVFIDFEGEPQKRFGERRIKRSGVRDVAGMLRSFQRVAEVAFRVEQDRGKIPADRYDEIFQWKNVWRSVLGGIYLKAYKEQVAGSKLLPGTEKGINTLLKSHLLEVYFQETMALIPRRDAGMIEPLRGILELLKSE